MDYIEARKILQREAELLDVLNEVTIHKGSVAYDAIKRMGQETFIEHHITSGDAQVFGYDKKLLTVKEAQERVFAPYEELTIPLSDEACELAITLIQDGFGDKTFEDSPFLKLFKKKGLFADGRTNESFREFCERHIDELDDYCEKMGKDIDEELHLIWEEPFEVSDYDDEEDDEDYNDEYDYEYEYVDEPKKDLKSDKKFTERKDINKKGERYSRYSILKDDPSDDKQ
jgi:hypothetical protein